MGYTTFAVNHDLTESVSSKKKKGKDKYDIPNLIRPRPEFIEKLNNVSNSMHKAPIVTDHYIYNLFWSCQKKLRYIHESLLS